MNRSKKTRALLTNKLFKNMKIHKVSTFIGRIVEMHYDMGWGLDIEQGRNKGLVTCKLVLKANSQDTIRLG